MSQCLVCATRAAPPLLSAARERANSGAARRAFPRADRGSNDAPREHQVYRNVPRSPPLPTAPFLPHPRGGPATFVRRMLAERTSHSAITERFRLSKIVNSAAHSIDFSLRGEFIVR